MFGKIAAFLKAHRNHTLSIILGAVVIAVGSFYWLSHVASLHAATIFNNLMARQKVLEGTVTVETLSANIHGGVTFTNLEWKDDAGNNKVVIPSGSLKVKPWDIVTRTVKASSLEELTLENADIALTFDERGHIKGIDTRREADKKKAPKKPGAKQPFDIKVKDINVKLRLVNCTMKAYFKSRIFLLNKVNADIHYNSLDKMDINFQTGAFGGVLVGDGVSIRGTVDLKPRLSECNLNLSIKELDPSSLGTGLNIKDKVTSIAHVSGPIGAPYIEGKLAMEKLKLPGLFFTKLTGDYQYSNGVITADNVKAKVYGGTCDANGFFNIDTKAYSVDVLGHDLQASMAAHTPLLNCDVELDLKMRCNGDNKSTQTYGTFTSGEGMYALIKFEKISGAFHNQYKVLQFTDVEINTPLGEIMSPHFTIVKGKLHLDSVYLGNKNTGEKTKLNLPGKSPISAGMH
jgi:hypothetical protein